MIAATPNGDIELRDMFAGTDRIPRPTEAGGVWSTTGRTVNVDDVIGLPAYMMGVRVLAETMATLPMLVYRGDEDSKQIARDAPQWPLFQEKPNPEMTPYQFWAFVTACRQGWPGAYVMKGKASLRGDRRVLTLEPLEPSRVTPRCEKNQLLFDVAQQDGTHPQTLSRQDILYIPSVLFGHPYIGVSPVTAHREALGGALALQEYGNRFFSNDATPGLVITAGEETSGPQRDEARESWNARHRGVRHSHGTAVLPRGFTVQQIGVSPQDAQYIEGQRWSVEQVARVLKLPNWILGGPDTQPRVTPEQRNMEFLQFSVAGHLVATEQALHADDDLFPDKTLRPAFLADGMLRADTAARFQAYLQGRQAGWLSANDIRAREGLPPIEGGDVYQQTPVGGAPNLQPGAGDTNPDGGAVEPPAGPVT